MKKKPFSEVCAKLFSNIFNKNGINHKLINNRILVRSASKKMLIDFNDMTVNFDTDEQFRMKKFAKVSYNNMIETRRRYEGKLVSLAKFIDKDNYTDLRKLRKDLRKQALHDTYNRESALLYINGKFYEGNTHAICLQQYLEEEKNNYVDSHERYREDEFEKYTSDKDIIAFAHKGKEEYKNYKDFKNDVITPAIFLETSTLQNISEEEATKLFNEHYNLPVYDDDSNDEEGSFLEEYKQLIAKRIDLRKQARHDIENRECAILYIDGEFYEDLSHADCLAQYNKAHNIDKKKRTNYRKNNFDEIAEEDHKIAFAHKTNEQTTVDDFMNDADPTDHIFIEERTLVNITLTEAAEAFKKQYPDIPIYNDDTNDEEFPSEYEKLASGRKDFRKMVNRIDLRNKRKDLRKKADHDAYNRECAILYINGEFYEGRSHADCLTAYKEANGEKSDQKNLIRSKNFDEDTLNENKIAFAHKVLDNYSEDDYENYVDKENFIFIERNSLSNITMDEAVTAFKAQYPNIKIFDDDSNDDEEAYPEQYEQLASERKDFRKFANRRDLRKVAEHDVDSRDEAILYVDGQIFFGETHGECMNEFLSSKDESLYNTYDRFPTLMRPDLLDRDSITEDNYDDEEDYQEDKDMLTVYDNAKEYAFAHLVDDEIYIEENSLYNLSIEEATKKIKDLLGDGYKYYNDDLSDKNDDTGYKRLAKKM